MKLIQKQPSLLSPINEESYIKQRFPEIDHHMKVVCLFLPQLIPEYKAYQKNNAAKRYRGFKASLKKEPITKKDFNSSVDAYESLYKEKGKSKNRMVDDVEVIYSTYYQLDKLITLFALYAALWDKYEADGNAPQAKAAFSKLSETFGSIDRATLEKGNSNISSGFDAHETLCKEKRVVHLKKMKNSADMVEAKAKKKLSEFTLVIETFENLDPRHKVKSNKDLAKILREHNPKITLSENVIKRNPSEWRS